MVSTRALIQGDPLVVISDDQTRQYRLVVADDGTLSTVRVPSPPITAPQTVTITPQSDALSVAFAAPADNGGDPIQHYTVTASPGTATAQGAVSPLVLTGLDNGTEYTVSVVATNAYGDSPAATATGTPVGVGSAPSVVRLFPTGQPGELRATWTGATAGGGTITGYEIKVAGGSVINTGSTDEDYIFTGLPNGTPLTIQVAALTDAGEGVYSDPVSRTPGSTPDSIAQALFLPFGDGRWQMDASAYGQDAGALAGGDTSAHQTWFEFIPAADGTITLNSDGSTIGGSAMDAVFIAYSTSVVSPAFADLTQVATAHNSTGPSGSCEISFAVIAGVRYYVQLAPNSTDQATPGSPTLTLNWSGLPVEALAQGPVKSLNLSSSGAGQLTATWDTPEAGEPDHYTVTYDSGSGASAPVTVAGGTDTVNFSGLANGYYTVTVTAVWPDATTNAATSDSLPVGITPPQLGSRIARAIQVSTAAGTDTQDPLSGDYLSQTTPDYPQNHADVTAAWYRFTPSANCNLTLDNLGSGTSDMFLEVYQGSAGATQFSDLTVLASDDDSAGGAKSLISNLPLTGGQTYYVANCAFSAVTGSYVLNWSGFAP